MLVVDIRHHCYRRKQLQERPVAFIGLGDHQLTATEPRVAAERAQTSADDRRRIEPGPLEHECNHRRRRGLPVRAGDRDAEPQPHQLRKHLRPRDHGNLPASRLANLRVRGPDRRRDHHHVRVTDVGRVVPIRHADAHRRQPLRDRGSLLVGSADDVTEVGEQFRDAAHPDAANPDKMHSARAA